MNRDTRWTDGDRSPGSWLACAVFALTVIFGAAFYVGASDPAADVERPTRTAVPAEYAAWVRKAESVCPDVDSPLIEAQVDVDSGWDPDAVSAAGAEGLAQFTPSMWADYGIDANGNGVASPLDPADAIMALAELDCRTVEQVKPDLAAGRIHGDLIDIVLATFHCGYDCAGALDVDAAAAPAPGTAEYIAAVKARMTGN